jgi:hypothetical protein
MSLELLIIRAGVPSGPVSTAMFKGATLVKDTLYVPDVDRYGFVRRCYAAQLRSVIPTLTLKCEPPPIGAATVKPTTQPGSAFKKAYRGQIQKAHQGDML